MGWQHDRTLALFGLPEIRRPGRKPFSENSHSIAEQGGEMTHWGARTRQFGTFPVDRENISPAQNAGLPEGVRGPLGVGPTCILILTALDTLRCPLVHGRRARSTFLHKSGFSRIVTFFSLPGSGKRVPGTFPLPSSPRAHCGAKEMIHYTKKCSRKISLIKICTVPS